jgi:hypothetical protein
MTKICDIRERKVTIRSEIRSTNIRSLGFQDNREWVTLWRLTLWRLTLWSLGCIGEAMEGLCHVDDSSALLIS